MRYVVFTRKIKQFSFLRGFFPVRCDFYLWKLFEMRTDRELIREEFDKRTAAKENR